MTFQNKLTGYYDEPSISVKSFDPLSANPKKWSKMALKVSRFDSDSSQEKPSWIIRKNDYLNLEKLQRKGWFYEKVTSNELHTFLNILLVILPIASENFIRLYLLCGTDLFGCFFYQNIK